MGVRRDHELHARLDRRLRVRRSQVEPVRAAVDLEEGARPGGGLDDGLDVELVPVPAPEQPARRMGDHVDVRVLDRGEQPARRPLGVLTLADVQRGDDPVEPGEQLVVVVQRPVDHHVDLGAGEQREAVERGGVLADLLDVALAPGRGSSPIPMPTPAE